MLEKLIAGRTSIRTQSRSQTLLMSQPLISTIRYRFMTLAFAFQGSLLLASLAIGRVMGLSVWKQMPASIYALLVGLVATSPMLLFLVFVYQSRAKELIEIRVLIRDLLGETLAACRWYDLIILALLAGFSEEFLFRGMLEPLFSRFGWLIGLVACNLLFGICHAVTPAYAVMAGLMGGYLSLTVRFGSEPNLMIPIICHSLYDLIAFIVVRSSYLAYVAKTHDRDEDIINSPEESD